MSDCVWIHLIDNTAAQCSIIRGSSSVRFGDVIVGLAWERVQARRAWLFIDRVASSSNPVDGLSRGRMAGPWEEVHQANVPIDVISSRANECGEQGVHRRTDSSDPLRRCRESCGS